MTASRYWEEKKWKLGLREALSTSFPLREVLPERVPTFDEFNLPRSTPTFQLLLARYGVLDVAEEFTVDESGHPVSLGESVDLTALVLVHSPLEVVGNADVEHP